MIPVLYKCFNFLFIPNLYYLFLKSIPVFSILSFKLFRNSKNHYTLICILISLLPTIIFSLQSRFYQYVFPFLPFLLSQMHFYLRRCKAASELLQSQRKAGAKPLQSQHQATAKPTQSHYDYPINSIFCNNSTF